MGESTKGLDNPAKNVKLPADEAELLEKYRAIKSHGHGFVTAWVRNGKWAGFDEMKQHKRSETIFNR